MDLVSKDRNYNWKLKRRTRNFLVGIGGEGRQFRLSQLFW